MEEYTVGGWQLTQDAGAVVVEGHGQKITIPGDRVADLIAGLLIVNPGPGLAMVTSMEVAQHHAVTPQTARKWFTQGLVPGAVLIESEGAQRGAYTLYLMPKAALDEIERPARGNKDISEIARTAKKRP